MSNNAIVVEPSIQFLLPAQNMQPNMDKVVIDSTEYDLNRTVARQDVATTDSNKLEVKGFHKLYFFDTEASLLDAVKQFTAHQNEVEIDDFQPANSSKDKTLFALVFGRVGFQATDKFIPIANPVYRVYPSGKSGSYLNFSDIKEYIHKGWLDAFHKAITLNTGDGTGAATASKPNNSQTVLAKGAAMGVFGALLLFLFGIGISQAFAYLTKTPASTSSYSNAALTGVTAGIPASNGDTSGQELYESESDKLLKRMNINLDDNQNIGCFTK